MPHWEIGTALGILDNERAVKISGSMFTMLRGLGATMSRAACASSPSIATPTPSKRSARPSLVTTDTLTATGQLPKFADDAYAIERDDLWCIPTAEVPLTSLGRDEIFAEADLPMRFMAVHAVLPARGRLGRARHAGPAAQPRVRQGGDPRLRHPGPGARPSSTSCSARGVATIEALGLPYRILDISTGDLGQSHHRSFDIEVYAPGCDQWLEVSSVSWFGDYQARRGNIRYRPTGAKGTEVLHTLNGSALAVPRVLAAILETYRRPDGSVAIPDALWPYTRGARQIPARS